MQPTMKADGGLRMKHDNDYTIGLRNIWEVVCYGSDGQEKWREINKNLVTTAGANHVLDGTFKSGTQITSWFVGLKAAGTPVIADTVLIRKRGFFLEFTFNFCERVFIFHFIIDLFVI